MRLLALACSLGSASAYTTAPSFQASGSKHSFSLVSDIYVPPEPREDCKGVSAATSDDWCSTSCVMDPPNCPASLCECEGGNPGAKPETESENSERKRMAEIYENERKAEETREVAEAQRVQEDAMRADADEQRIADTDKTTSAATAAASPAPLALVASGPKSCKALAGMSVEWCETECNKTPSNCPADLCECSDEVKEEEASPSPEPVLATATTREASSTQQEVDRVLADKQRVLEDKEAERMQAEALRIAAEQTRVEVDKQRVAQSDTSVKDAWKVRANVKDAWGTDACEGPGCDPNAKSAVEGKPSKPASSPTPKLRVARETSPEEATAAKVAEEAEVAREEKEAARVAEQELRAASDASRVDQDDAGVNAQWETTAKKVEEAIKAKAQTSPAPNA